MPPARQLAGSGLGVGTLCQMLLRLSHDRFAAPSAVVQPRPTDHAWHRTGQERSARNDSLWEGSWLAEDLYRERQRSLEPSSGTCRGGGGGELSGSSKLGGDLCPPTNSRKDRPPRNR